MNENAETVADWARQRQQVRKQTHFDTQRYKKPRPARASRGEDFDSRLLSVTSRKSKDKACRHCGLIEDGLFVKRNLMELLRSALAWTVPAQ